MMKNRNRNNARYLSFNSSEERGRFVLLYKDLFTPYSMASELPIRAKKDGNEAVLKQLLEGYCIDSEYTWRQMADYGDYQLVINILPENWEYILKHNNFEKIKFLHHRYLWRLV